LDRTPFYATAGGQIADSGSLSVAGRELSVRDVQRRGSRILHRVEAPLGKERDELLELLREHPVYAEVDAARRRAIARAHTATHLLHAALHQVVGEECTQAGSWVGPDRFRFDFNHFRAVSGEELREIEEQVTAWILANLPVRHETLTLQDALDRGAMALFGEKYGDEVRTVSVGQISLELCGGTHLSSSGEIGSFLVLSEGSVASGVRRIEALTGLEAQRLAFAERQRLAEIGRKLRSPAEALGDKLDELLAERQKLRKDLEDLRASQAAARSGDLLRELGRYGELVLMSGEIEAENPKEIRSMADSIRQGLGDKLALLKARAGGKLSFLVLVPDALAPQRAHAGQLVAAAAAAVGGRGGGSPTLAQAGLAREEDFPRIQAALGEALAGKEG
jgi:alanyl-tRNA synthetase